MYQYLAMCLQIVPCKKDIFIVLLHTDNCWHQTEQVIDSMAWCINVCVSWITLSPINSNWLCLLLRVLPISIIFIKVGDYLRWGFDLLDIHQRKYQLVSIWGMWLLMSIWITLLPLLCISRGLCRLVCCTSSFLNHLSTIIVQLNVTLIHIGFRRHIVITFLTHWWCVLLINLTNILVIASH